MESKATITLKNFLHKCQAQLPYCTYLHWKVRIQYASNYGMGTIPTVRNKIAIGCIQNLRKLKVLRFSDKLPILADPSPLNQINPHIKVRVTLFKRKAVQLLYLLSVDHFGLQLSKRLFQL